MSPSAEVAPDEALRRHAEKRADAAYFDRLPPDDQERVRAEEAALPHWWGECIQEWRTAQELLTGAGVPGGKGSQVGGNLDSRIARYVVPALGALGRIAEAHHKQVDAHGGTSGDCNECGWTWPCPTFVWASSLRDSLACWNPADDEEAADVH